MSPHVVVSEVARPDPALVGSLGAAGVATVHEAMGRTGLLQPELRPIYDGAAIAGPAVTVSCPPGDNMMIHLAVEHCRPGDVMVIAVTSRSTDGMIGELLATSMRAHGVVGVVIDAGVRDVKDLRQMAFPVWSRAVSAQGTVKASPGAVNVPVICAGQRIEPGDVVVADDDGVAVVPADRAAQVAAASDERLAREAEVRERLAAGELGADIYGLRHRAVELGVEYVDGSRPDGAGPLHQAGADG